MAMSRWEPFGEMMSLRDAMNRLFEESVVRPRTSMAGMAGTMSMPMDVRETEDGYEVWFACPGCHPEDVDITIQQDTLRISGNMHGPEFKHGEEGDRQQGQMSRQQGGPQGQQGREQGGQQPREQWLLREIPQGNFSRTITFPSPVDANKANAEFDAGILHIHLPKAEEAKPRRLQVKGESGQRQTEVQKGR